MSESKTTFNDEQQAQIREIIREETSTNVSRRGVLGAAGAGLLGIGAGAYGGSQRAAAQEAGSGTIGTAEEPLEAIYVDDLFNTTDNISTDSIQNNIGGADIQTAWDGLVVPVGPGLGMDDAIDPNSSSSPVQDAIDSINVASGQGAVLLPPTTVQETGPLTDWGGIRFQGHSSDAGGSEIELTGSNPLIQCTSANDRSSYWDGIQLDGDGASQPAMQFDADPAGFHIGRLRIDNFTPGSDGVIRFNGGAPWASEWGYVRIGTGCTGRGITTVPATGTPGSPQLSIGCFEYYGTGGNTAIYDEDGPDIHIGALNIGGEPSQAVYCDKNFSRRLSIGWINFDPTGGTHPNIVEMQNEGQVKIDYIKNRSGVTVDSMVQGEFEHGNSIIGQLANDGTVNNNKIVIDSAPNGPNWYFGPASDITNNTGTDSWYALEGAGTTV
ncbi:hypothetical protein [Natronorubrum halophilum]|uniref:hypothetical protein n=1 Tax=Natronorubrum halophilum TaxID=1702106 RepID=UPI000EF661F3|nr:hypothetical protein [Natronorubrum halophilum]